MILRGGRSLPLPGNVGRTMTAREPLMNAVEQIKQQGESLTAEERAELAHFFLTSLAPDDNRSQADWGAVLAQRVEEIRNGTAVGRDVDEVLAELEQRFP